MSLQDPRCLAELSLMAMLSSESYLRILEFIEKHNTATYMQIRNNLKIHGEVSNHLRRLRYHILIEYTKNNRYQLTFRGKRIMKLIHNFDREVKLLIG